MRKLLSNSIANGINRMLAALPRFNAPTLFALGFLFQAISGSVIGIVLSQGDIDRAYPNTPYVVAHFRYTMSIAAVFLLFAGIYLWFGKVAGRRYSEVAAKLHFWLFFIGVSLAFFPQQFPGRQVVRRRYIDYPETNALLNQISAVGALIACASVVLFFGIVLHGVMRGKKTEERSS